MHRSHEDLEGHMNTGIEWPVYAYVGLSEGEEVARLRAALEQIGEKAVRTAEAKGPDAADLWVIAIIASDALKAK